MSVAELHDLELNWPSLGPTDVIVTGSFDQWSSSVHLAKGDGGFFGTVKVPWGHKIAYKYIVDGRWRCRDDRPQEEDGHGNVNNIFLTPEKPASSAAQDPPRLSIPLDGGHGDIETMVTAVEYLPSPAEHATIAKESLPPPIPQITVDLSRTPVMSEPKLDTATATEGDMPPASVIPAGSAQGPFSSDEPIVSRPQANGNGKVLEGAKGDMAESAVPQPDPSSGAHDVPVITDRIDTPPGAVAEPTARQPAADIPVTQVAAPTSINPASAPSTPSSSTVTQKKRRSLFAKIKHIFDKDKDKREKKEKSGG